ncbi:glycosyltransferase [Baekduia soli]|uniref:Glycosyltransferase n=1 Tax=Baekduia soli TaxID=496014 RepID=A0A5B8U0P8_9ACTN|nr:glycosyltransferase [Baekduia soli]QEC46510.1 glycosyltransferase [Baekduia soli]
MTQASSTDLSASAPPHAWAPAPAPSAPIAAAARAFGDDYPGLTGQWRVKVAGLLLLLTTVLYVPWMLRSLDAHLPWLAYPFAAANLYSLLYGLVSVANAWQRRVPPRRPLPAGDEPGVAVIIPTCGESVPMILRTIVSVLGQDWPAERLTVIVSDDGHDPALEAALAAYPVRYHEPPPRDAPGRDGAAKAGNLNSAVALLDAEYPDIRYIETRDADDELGSDGFLRQVVGQLEARWGLAFVQTIKEAQVSAGDPFNNRESMFYRGQMLARNAANAVFPCGSGVVWRRTALREIGDFPTWNLVEDLQSGVEALRRGWSGMYLPIVGAVGQHSPEDVPNVYKQRGTWAIDTVRLLIWGRLSGLTLRQRLHFAEMLMFYLNAFTVLVYLPSIACSLLGYTPLAATRAGYLGHMLPLVLATEVWLLVVNHPFYDRRRRQRRRLRALWHVRIMWTGMAPIYMRATVQAVLGGRTRKPVYRVTRKVDDVRWHWRHTLPQTGLVLAVFAVLVYAVGHQRVPSVSVLAGAVYWGGMNIILLTGFVTRGWHGLGRVRSAVHGPSPLEGVIRATPEVVPEAS